MQIIEARKEHFPEIIVMIRKVWDATYRHILTVKQVEFMQDALNTVKAFEILQYTGHVFYIAIEEERIVGFISFLKLEDGLRIPKLYVDYSVQNRGIGTLLLNSVKRYALENKLIFIELNVNRYNKALYFYRRYGFYILSSVDISFGDFWLNDYVMRLDL